MSILACSSCGTRNRVGPIPHGTPRCAKCKQPLPWVVEADSETFDDEITASVPVLVDFWAPWCAPCRMVAPVLADLATHHAGRLKVVKLNVDENPGPAATYDARSIPLLVVIEGGVETDRILGAQPAAVLEERLFPELAAN
jgi:thioredoxin 2